MVLVRGAAMGMAAAMLALGFVPGALSTTLVDQGFTTGFVTEGNETRPANSVSSVRMGNDVYYWVEWKDHPATKASVRCVITQGSGGPSVVDHTDLTDEAEAEGFTVCGMDTDDGDTEPGTYVFAQYIDGEKIAERSISVNERPMSRLGIYRQAKFWIGASVLLVLGAGWLVKRKRDVTGPVEGKAFERAKTGKAREAVVIGARVGEGLAAQGGTFVRSGSEGDADELGKAARTYEMALPLADKAKTVEAGRRYLGLLMKARETGKALEVFRQCVAIEPYFRPERAEDVLPIAKAARAAGDAQTAVACLRGFDKIFPGHAAIPEVYVFSARLMAEDLGNPTMARKILEHVVQKYPGHFVAQEAKKLLSSLPA